MTAKFLEFLKYIYPYKVSTKYKDGELALGLLEMVQHKSKTYLLAIFLLGCGSIFVIFLINNDTALFFVQFFLGVIFTGLMVNNYRYYAGYLANNEAEAKEVVAFFLSKKQGK